jgi:hypothetical protein
LCDRWVRVFGPRRSRRLESNQPNVLYPKQAAHLAPPPSEYPGVELNHASDVRSVGSDPSTGACRLPWYRVRESNPRFRSENPVSSPAGRTRRWDARIEHRVGAWPGAWFRCEDSNLDGWCQRPGSCHWTTPEHIVEPSLGVEPSPLAYQASVPRRGHHDGKVAMQEDRGEDRNRTGRSRIASAARPLGTCLPRAVPTRIELAYRGRQPRILTRGFRDQMGASDAPVRPSHCAHHRDRSR